MVRHEVVDGSALDYEAFVKLQKEAFRDILAQSGVSDAFMRPEYYRWKYKTPVGYGRIAVVFDGSTMISVAAMLPLRLRFEESSLKAWQCLDVATIPGARGKGYFYGCLEALRETLESNEVFFAFPNKSSLPGFIKLRCRENLVVTTWVNPFAAATRRASTAVRQVEGFDREQDSLAEKLVGAGGPMLDHGSSYMNWRYPEHPNNEYVLLVHQENGPCHGCAVMRKARAMDRDVVLVMELWGVSSAVEHDLLRHIAGWSKARGVRMVVMMSTSFSLARGLASMFLPVPSVFLPKRQVLVVDATGGQAETAIGVRWRVQTGDWDVF